MRSSSLLRTSSLGLLGLSALLVLGCKPDPSADGGGSETASTESGGIASLSGSSDSNSTTNGDGDGDGDATTTNGDGDGSPGDGDGSGGTCGDGNLDPGENCDDGNTMSGDGCSSSCNPEGPIMCEGKLYQCGDTIDNDGDGLIDLEDPECLSPCDDDEASFKTNLPGQSEDCKADCYWDADSGSGQDKCDWNLQCDPANPGADIGCAYDPNFNMCQMEQLQFCIDFCTALIPNGCDCFGCCEIDGQFVYIDGAECALNNLDACSSCTFNEQCGNPCMPELCELCFGQDPDDLPPECDEPECPDNLQSCTDSTQCPEGLWCQTGCCVPIALP